MTPTYTQCYPTCCFYFSVIFRNIGKQSLDMLVFSLAVSFLRGPAYENEGSGGKFCVSVALVLLALWTMIQEN